MSVAVDLLNIKGLNDLDEGPVVMLLESRYLVRS